MKNQSLLCSTGLLALGLFFARSAWGNESLLRQADQAFNANQYTQAQMLYQQALQQIDNRQALYAEIVNNIAAARMAQGDLQGFVRHFTQARQLKQERPPATASTPPGSNRLINGGFEEGIIFPWGTGHYERADGKFNFGLWWNSNNARAFMKIDTAEKHSGQRSLLIGNDSPAAPHVFTTLSQRISGLKPNTLYRISAYLKARDLKPGAGLITVDAAWAKRFALPAGTYDWQSFSITVNIGHNDFIDFRIVQQDTGRLWLDDLVVEEAGESGDAPLQRAESLFDAARYGEAHVLLRELEEQHRGKEGPLAHIRLLGGRIDTLMGRYDQALAKFQWAIDKGLVRARIDLGDLHLQLGDFAAAENQYQKLLEQGVFKEDQATISLLWHKLSQSHLAAGQPALALQAQQRSYATVTHIGDQHAQAVSLHHLADIQRKLKNLAEARIRLLEALPLAEQLGDRKLSSDIRLDLAENAMASLTPEMARNDLAETLRIKESIADRPGLIKALHLQGQWLANAGQIEAALGSYERAVRLLEELAGSTRQISRQAQATYMQQFNRLYREYVDLLLRRYESTRNPAFHRQAFQIAEQARSRVFAEMLAEARASETFAATQNDPELKALLEKERLLALEIAGLENQIQHAHGNTTNSTPPVLTQRLAKARTDRQNLQQTLSGRYPRYAELKNPKPLRIEDVQQLLHPDEAALAYFVMPQRTALWAITRENARIILIAQKREELIRQSEEYRQAFSGIAESLGQLTTDTHESRLRQIFAAYRPEPAHALYRTLVSPAEALLRGKRSLYLAPDDLLYKLPFETLLTEPVTPAEAGTSTIGAEWQTAPFWVRQQSLSYLPSLSVLRSLRHFEPKGDKPQRPLIAFADPDFGSTPVEARAGMRSTLLRSLKAQQAVSGMALPPLPESRKEALHVAQILGARPDQDIYTGQQASESNVKRLPLKQYRNLLFATHGLMAGDFGPGTQPALALSFVGDPDEDGLLEMGEILGLELGAHLVVLSACNTASGSGGEDRGEGFAGLTRSFMYAGAQSLLVTQWSVESSSTARFVQSAFAQMTKNPKSEALARAKRDMIASREKLSITPELAVSLAHPFFWAPFVLVGEGR